MTRQERSEIGLGIEILDDIRERLWLAEAAMNRTEIESEAQRVYDAVAAMIARALSLIPPVEADDWI